MSEIETFTELMDNNEQMRPLHELVEQIMGLPESSLNEQTLEMMVGMISGAITPTVKEESVKSMIQGFEEMGHTKAAAAEIIEQSKDEIKSFIEELAPSKNKRILLEKVFDIFFEIFDAAVERYHNTQVKVEFQVAEGGHLPTYAHETDAAADMYANETVLIKAHSLGNFIHTGVRAALPEGWCAKILPRSSTGAKTPLRLSNSQGLIDPSYRGEIMLLFDNISDEDYLVNKGDRLAQLSVEPVSHFKAEVIEQLSTTERGEGGFGSTGK